MIEFAGGLVTLHVGDCLDVIAGLPDNSVDAVVTDPPYNLSFMGRSWDDHGGGEDAAFGYWLAGFIDGEGCFLVKGHSRDTYAPCFTLKLRRDDRAVLVAAQRFVAAGQVEDVAGDANPMTRWVVQDRDGCQRLVDVLDKYPLRAKKRLDYLAWREAVCEWTDRPRGNRWRGRADQARMLALRDRIREGRKYADPPWSGNDFQDWCRLWAAECLRVLKPGGHLLAFGGTRTYHRLTCAIEDAGFELRDSIAWLYGSGFPKSLDVSKAIDKAAGAERKVVGRYTPPDGAVWNLENDEALPGYSGGLGQRSASLDITAPATDEAKKWDGWGTALKPGHEPIVVARKPLAGTVAGNVLTHGTGALNIDGCRVGTDSTVRPATRLTSKGLSGGGFGHPAAERTLTGESNGSPAGRWPTNVVLTHAYDCAEGCEPDCPVAALDTESGTLTSGLCEPHHARNAPRLGHGGTYGDDAGAQRETPTYGDSGGASRFFPTFRWEAKAPTIERPRDGDVAHPTVKPLELMRWLVRLVTPPGGVVLDPFAGSGTTGEACAIEGFRCVLVEREAAYVPLIEARLSKPLPVVLF